MTPLARGYAQALLESAPAGFDIGQFLEGARAVLRAIESDPRLKAFFGAPGIAAGVKAKTLEELARLGGLDDFGRRFLGVVLGNRRILHLAERERPVGGLLSAGQRKRADVEADDAG